MNASGPCILQPHAAVGDDVHPPQSVQRDDVKLTDGLVVARRIARCHDHPAGGDPMTAEGLILQKLQHGGSQRLGHTVDLIDEEDALFMSRALHAVVNRGDDFTEGIFRNGNLAQFVISPLFNAGQTHRALAGVVSHGVGNQSYVFLRGDLFHDGGLADTGWAHEKNGPLAQKGEDIAPLGIFAVIGPQGSGNLDFSFFDIHIVTLSVIPLCPPPASAPRAEPDPWFRTPAERQRQPRSPVSPGARSRRRR